MCSCACVSIGVCKWPSTNLASISQVLTTFYETGFLTCLKLAKYARRTGHWGQGSTYLCIPSTERKLFTHSTITGIFNKGSGVSKPGLYACKASTYKPSYLPSATLPHVWGKNSYSISSLPQYHYYIKLYVLAHLGWKFSSARLCVWCHVLRFALVS